MFSKESLKNKLNQDLKELGIKIQSISKNYHQKSRLGSKSLFGDINDDAYAFHIGGLRELQFNLGWHDTKFRYGLAFSIQATRSLQEPTTELKPFIDYFNNIDESEKKYNLYKYGDGGNALNSYITPKTVDNTDGTFWFYGKHIDWNNGDINDQEYKDILETFEDLFNCYKKIMQGAKILKDIEEKVKLLKNRNQIILQGPPGTGKTRWAKQMAIYMIDGILPDTNKDIKNVLEQIDKDRVKLIQFHPSYSYEDFVRGIVATPTKDKKGIIYKTEDKVLVNMAEEAKKALSDEYFLKETSTKRKDEILEKADKYILIIDEINRANLSSVLGELIYALEYRDEAVESMYALENSSREITLPSNLYIIGTMNTADRSVGHIDYAIRRRFAFENVLPDINIDNVDKNKFLEVKKLFKKDDGKRADTLSPEFNPDDVMLGHSYFIANDEDELKEKIKYQVVPLLKEYIKDGVLTEDATEKINTLLS